MASVATVPLLYSRYPESLGSRCFSCGSRVEYLYPTRKRHFHGLTGSFDEIRYKYACTNKSCSFFDIPCNPSPAYALPHKHYALDVWKWIGREAKQFKQSASQISERIRKDFGVSIAETTIRRIMDEIDIYLSDKIDERTQKLISAQGKIVLAMDGQKPDDGEQALWLFTDVISNRVLKVVNIRHADHLTLHRIVDKILTTYDVELVGLLSDKQGSIVKMHHEFYSNIPHQYCQFHFLQNLWSYIESKDTHLHQQLRSTINHLPIVVKSKTVEVRVPGVGQVNFREYFKEIESDLRKLIKNRGKKFEKARGVVAYDKIARYAYDLKEVVDGQDPDHRISKILGKTAEKLKELLQKQSKNYSECIQLLSWFSEIRAILAKGGLSKSARDRQLAAVFNVIWEKVRRRGEFSRLIDLRTRMAKVSMTMPDIGQQWVRMHRSYRKGLFAYYDFPSDERTNSNMEAQFGHEKSTFMARSGKANVGRQIRVRGLYILKQQYAGNAEVQEHLNNLPGSYERSEVKKGLKDLAEKQKQESNRWESRLGGKDALLRLYSQKKSKKGGT
jgi:hypothetical protein